MALQVLSQPQGMPQTPLGVRNAPAGVPSSLSVTQAPQQQLQPVAPVQQPQFNGVQPLQQQPVIAGQDTKTTAMLGQLMKNKYPGSYDDVPDDKLGEVTKTKYPGAYDDFASAPAAAPAPTPDQPKSVLGFAGNIVKSTGSLLGNTATGIANIFNPDVKQNTVANAAALLTGAAKSTFSGGQSSTATFDNFTKLMAERYGGWDKFKNTLYTDPAGVALDLSTVLDPAGRALGLAGDASKISQLSKVGEITTKVADAINPITRTADVIKGATNFGGRILGKAGGVTTGTGDALKQTFLNPSADQASAMRGNTSPEQILGQAKDALTTMKDSRSSDYRTSLSQIKEANVPQDMASIQAVADKKLTDFGIKKVADEAGKPVFDFSGSAISDPAEQARIERIYNDVANWKDQNATGLDTLKRRVASEYSPNSDVRAFTQSVKGSIRDQLNNTVPGYKAMTGSYEQASNMIDDITKSLSLGDKASAETGIKKLSGALKENNEMRAELLKQLEEAGGKDITGMVAGQQLSAPFGRGVTSKLFEGGGIIAGLSHLINPATLSLLVTTSPRLMGELARGLGLTRQALISGLEKVPQPIRSNFGRGARDAAFVNSRTHQDQNQ